MSSSRCSLCIPRRPIWASRPGGPSFVLCMAHFMEDWLSALVTLSRSELGRAAPVPGHVYLTTDRLGHSQMGWECRATTLLVSALVVSVCIIIPSHGRVYTFSVPPIGAGRQSGLHPALPRIVVSVWWPHINSYASEMSKLSHISRDRGMIKIEQQGRAGRSISQMWSTSAPHQSSIVKSTPQLESPC